MFLTILTEEALCNIPQAQSELQALQELDDIKHRGEVQSAVLEQRSKQHQARLESELESVQHQNDTLFKNESRARQAVQQIEMELRARVDELREKQKLEMELRAIINELRAKMEEQMEEQKQKQDGLEGKVTTLVGKLKELQHHSAELEKRLSTKEKEISIFTRTLKQLQDFNKELESRALSAESSQGRAASIEVQNLDSQLRSTKIR